MRLAFNPFSTVYAFGIDDGRARSPVGGKKKSRIIPT
jgi:hypothetical protein